MLATCMLSLIHIVSIAYLDLCMSPLLDGYTTDELQFVWKEIMAVQINEELELPQFDLMNFIIVDCEQSYITGTP